MTLPGPPDATHHISLTTNSGETISLEVTTADDTVMQEDPSPNANTDTNQPDTITDDVPFLEITIGEEEMAQLYQEAMDEPPETLSTENNPRDGLNPLTPEPTLPELGPGDIKIIVEAPKEPNTATEEIINNKTVRVNGEEQPSRTPNDDKVCCGCAAIGHVLVS